MRQGKPKSKSEPAVEGGTDRSKRVDQSVVPADGVTRAPAASGSREVNTVREG